MIDFSATNRQDMPTFENKLPTPAYYMFVFESTKNMGGVLTYQFPNESAEAIVPYYERYGKMHLSLPKKFVGNTPVIEKDLSDADVVFLNECLDKTFIKLTNEGHSVEKP